MYLLHTSNDKLNSSHDLDDLWISQAAAAAAAEQRTVVLAAAAAALISAGMAYQVAVSQSL